MKPKLSTLISVLAVTATVFLSYNHAITNSTTPPASTAGDPGAGTCANSGCHDVQALLDPSKIEIKMDPISPFIVANPMDNSFQYHLDTLYKVLFQIEALISIEYGFQLCALDTNGNSVGNFIPLGSNLTATQTGFSGRQYINHNNSSANPSWTFDWQSPSTDPGPVTFYACVVRGVADNMASSLDKVFRTEVTINALPSSTTGVTANAGTDVSICAGESVQLNASGGTTYSWSPTTGLNNPTIPNPIASPGSTTTYTVTVSDGGNTDTDDVIVSVNPLPQPTIGQSGDTVFTNQGFASYEWFANGTVIPGSSYFLITAANGFYHVVVTDGNSCEGVSDSTQITTHTGVTANAGADVEICQNESTQLSASGGITYSWSPTNGLSNPNIPNPIASPASTTTYTVIVSDGVNGDTDDVIVTVNSLPSPMVSLAGNTLTTSSGFSSYQWFLNGTSVSGANSNSHVAQSSGFYHVEVVDNNMCTGQSDSVEVSLPSSVDEQIFEAEILSNILGPQTKLKIPNELEIRQFQVLDISGTLVLNGQGHQVNELIQLHHKDWSLGMYFIIIETNRGLLKERLIKL